ncbi:hypothetical protein A4G99_16495 [Haladaptatus sp. R4]|nr:hypothetical protein A4G99_16495 [Haladaptatus sp. R4]
MNMDIADIILPLKRLDEIRFKGMGILKGPIGINLRMEFDFDVSSRVVHRDIVHTMNVGVVPNRCENLFLGLFRWRTIEKVRNIFACQLNAFMHNDQTDECASNRIENRVSRPHSDYSDECSDNCIEIVETISRK